MGLLDAFRRRPPDPPDPGIAYAIAYFLLPQYAFQRPDRLTDLISRMPTVVGRFFYTFACQHKGVEPRGDHAELFRCHQGERGQGLAYFVLEYPVPRPIDLTGKPMPKVSDGIVLAPHFSVVFTHASHEVRYFVLGQAPMGGGTTLREVASDRGNYNLGPGPEPTLEAFLSAAESRATRGAG